MLGSPSHVHTAVLLSKLSKGLAAQDLRVMCHQADARFPPQAGLLTISSLEGNEHLQDLYLMGNPCADWPGYRQYIIAKLPQLQKLVGMGKGAWQSHVLQRWQGEAVRRGAQEEAQDGGRGKCRLREGAKGLRCRLGGRGQGGRA